MNEDRLPRKLLAILHADVAGYSRLSGADEDATHRRLKESLTLITSTVDQHYGQVVNYAGDAVLARFDAAVDALACATAIQSDLKERNANVPDERKVEFRIGLNLGDVIEDRGDIYGDGVNVAARLETLADPGGICISEAVRNAVGTKLPLAYEFMGEQRVKNIAEPLRTYHVSLASDQKSVHKKTVQPRSRTQTLWIAAPVVLAVVTAVLIWQQPWAPTEESVSDTAQAWEMPDKPSIAVLPFNNMSDDRTQEYFSDGMAEDIITDLSKISGLFVIARNSTFQYKRTPVDIRDIARELGVRYVLEGSVRKAGDQVRINAQLIDAITGGHLWADRYDGRLDNVFELQDEVARKIITALAVQLTAGEEEGIGRRETESAEAYDAFLQGWDHYLRQTPEDFVAAVTHFEKAIDLDPKYSLAYAALAATYWEVWKRFWHNDLKLPHGSHEPRFRAEQFLIKAMQDPTPLAHQVASAMLLHQQQYEDAIAEAQRAIAVDPNDADSYVALAAALSLSGKAREALDWVERAMRHNPHYPAFYLYQLGLAQFAQEEFLQAAISLEKATALNPDDRWSQRLLIAAYGALNRTEDAARVLEAAEERGRRGWLNTMDPLTIRTSAFWLPFKQQADAERLARGLRNAGVPD